jgi:3-hydroxyacyl-CoA dehydrogenase/enoyl-CoA hydratase/3-hydroxybutyryl-CoA epimerase
MGAGIATVAVQGGLLVRLTDASGERAAAGWRTVRDAVRARLRRRRLTPVEYDTTLARLSVATDGTGFAKAEVVIEAVFEELALKQQVRREVEAAAPGAIFASNTSTIPIADIAAGAADPGTVIGMHFFSPVAKMPLLEVIVTPATAPETVATAVACGRQLGKTVIVVRDAPGFYVNRILAPYLAEAGRLLDEGAAMDAVDRACAAFGLPVGPFTLLDEVGLDVAGKAGPIMAAAYGARLAPAQALTRVVADGRLGRKAQRGFYRYDAAGKRQGPDASVYALTAAGAPRRAVLAEEVRRRTILPLLNEAVRCLEEGIIASPRDGDIGAIFGIGFPPFRGGPFRYLDTLGAAAVVRDLEALDARFPGRFTPATRLRALADSGGRFHP